MEEFDNIILFLYVIQPVFSGLLPRNCPPFPNILYRGYKVISLHNIPIKYPTVRSKKSCMHSVGLFSVLMVSVGTASKHVGTLCHYPV